MVQFNCKDHKVKFSDATDTYVQSMGGNRYRAAGFCDKHQRKLSVFVSADNAKKLGVAIRPASHKSGKAEGGKRKSRKSHKSHKSHKKH